MMEVQHAGHTILVNRAAGFVVVGKQFHQDQVACDRIPSRIAFHERLVEKSKGGKVYEPKVAAFKEAQRLVGRA